jgi:Rhodopirellula transposase DDE domain
VEDKAIELSDEQKQLYKDTAEALKGHERRVFMARVVKTLGRGGQRQSERELGWDRAVIRRGMHELDSGLRWVEAYGARGRKRAEELLPNLLIDLAAIVDGQSQTDPTFESTRLYTRLSAAAVRQALISQKGYTDAELPSEETIRVKLNNLGYHLRSVKKSVPQKKLSRPTPSSSS